MNSKCVSSQIDSCDFLLGKLKLCGLITAKTAKNCKPF